MSRERNEHSVESEMEGIRKGYIYILALLFQIQTKKKRTLVPVPLVPVPVPLAQKVAMAIWYRYHTNRYRYRRAEKGQIRVFFPILTPFHLRTSPFPYKRDPNLLFSLTRANPRLHVPTSVFIVLTRILLSSSHRHGKHPSFL